MMSEILKNQYKMSSLIFLIIYKDQENMSNHVGRRRD